MNTSAPSGSSSSTRALAAAPLSTTSAVMPRGPRAATVLAILSSEASSAKARLGSVACVAVIAGNLFSKVRWNTSSYKGVGQSQAASDPTSPPSDTDPQGVDRALTLGGRRPPRLRRAESRVRRMSAIGAENGRHRRRSRGRLLTQRGHCGEGLDLDSGRAEVRPKRAQRPGTLSKSISSSYFCRSSPDFVLSGQNAANSRK